ncbi:universal stress protein [Pedobacter alluvionis]|uniref:Nucleotide-binding universal stress UspA family protein n=1 Tax=Pedobacter alluvionis TaxID=475253 RepID=A0A497YDQ1_9SPHI|nr:universal stress protein [Pedobacter alluvionis]RLJ79639.1 nucleotide-binding universal stress UspA family protein [Pedobacter alluvionis]TFB30966.1 universal stress protein [Pedobacter alluvionis]
MKKILVPVDFSPAAENAANYATDLAYNIGARIELFNVFQVPVVSPVAASMVWPYQEYSQMEDDAKKALEKLLHKVEKKYEAAYQDYSLKPEVYARSVRGEVDDEVYKYFTECKMNLVVMGLNSASKFSKILIGSNARKMIEREIPLLLIPTGYQFRKPKKIAFATDFSHSDIPVLCALAEFAKPFNADILIMHTGNSTSDPAVYKETMEGFLNRVADRVNYRNIYHRHVNSKRVKDGLDWIVENGQIDMLAMVHRKHGFFYRLFNGSYTLNMSDHIQIPLLVLPPEHRIPM